MNNTTLNDASFIIYDLFKLRAELELDKHNPMACKILKRLEKILFVEFPTNANQPIKVIK